MKVAAIADIHGNGIALKYAIQDIKSLGINKVIILGDVVIKGPMPSHVLDMLCCKDIDVMAWIKGNTDMWFEEISENWEPSTENEIELLSYFKYAKHHLSDDQISLINKLPYHQSITINGKTILCVHGTPKSINKAITFSVSEEEIMKEISGVDEQVILCGHSHTVYSGEISDKKIFNVGSIGNSADGDNRISYGILTITDKEIRMENRRIGYPIREAIEAAMICDYPNVEKYIKFLETARI